MGDQLAALEKGVDVLIATPGRLMDLFGRGKIMLNQCSLLVIDEADRMLDMGFIPDIEEICTKLPSPRQTLLFSATMPAPIKKLADRFMTDPRVIEVARPAESNALITQLAVEVSPRGKREALRTLLRGPELKNAIIFCNRKKDVRELFDVLKRAGFKAGQIHGDMDQSDRIRELDRFKNDEITILVASDVAARGLDVPGVSHVFNYDVPHHADDYVHRIGRTGRAGRSGRAVSFVYGREIYRLQSIERYTRSVIKRERIPSVEQVEGRRADLIFDDLKERLESGKFENYQDNIDRLLEQGHTPTDIAGALVTMIREASGREGGAIEEDREPERPARRENVRPQRDDHGGHQRDDRGPRQERFERAPRGEIQGTEAGMTRLFLSLGKTHGVMAKEIVGMLYREVGLPDGCLGRISLFPKHSLVDVPEQFVSQVMDRTRNARLRGRPFRMDVDRGPGDRG
jgi:ATP-dependent RNA helicase DeaD